MKYLWRLTGSGKRETFCASLFINDCDVRIRQCRDSEFISLKMAKCLRSLLANKAISLQGTEYPLVGSHWDFRAANVVISRSMVTAIDWEQYHPSRSPYQDASCFWADLGIMSVNPFIQTELIRNLQNLFSETLVSELNPELFWVWKVNSVLWFAARDANRKNTHKMDMKGTLIELFSKHCYKRELMILTKEAEKY